MADIRVDTNKLRSQAQRLATIKRRLDSLKGRMSSFDNSYSDRLETYTLQKCITYLNGVADEFERTEQYVQKFDPKKFNPMQVIVDQLFPSIPNISPNLIRDYLKKASPFSKIVGAACGTAAVAEWEGSLGFKDEKLFNDWLKKKWGKDKDDKSVKYNYKEKPLLDKHKGNSDEWDDEKATILEVKASKKVEGSLASAEASGSSKFAQGTIKAAVSAGEAHMEASAGLYTYDKNGKKIFSPAVKAEVGASYAVLQVNAEGRVGLGKDNDMLGLYGKGDVKVGTAEGKASVSLKKGELHGKLSAEADLVKAEGSAGISVLGADVGVKGSVKVGIGAHVDIGVKDWKFKCDIGAALGVGFDLGIEVDLKGAGKAIAGAAKSAWDGFTGFIGGLFH